MAEAHDASLTGAMLRAYRDPRAAMARQMGEGLSETRALFHLMLACGLGFVASVPAALRTAARLDIADPVEGAVTAHLFGYVFMLPLLLLGLAAVLHLGARVFGGRGSFLGVRAALFWAALLAAPIALGLALLRVVAERLAGPGVLPWLDLLGYAGFAFWLWLLAASLAEAEGFAATGRVAAALALAFGGIALGLGALAGAAAPAG